MPTQSRVSGHAIQHPLRGQQTIGIGAHLATGIQEFGTGVGTMMTQVGPDALGACDQAASRLSRAKLLPSARADPFATARPASASLVMRLGWKRTSLTSSIPAHRSQSLK
jgi:hypothetical protein